MGERIIFFLFHSLTNQPKRSRTNTYVLLLHTDHILPSSVRIRNSVCTCLNGFKAGSMRWFRFPREFSSLFRASRVQLRRCSGNSAGLLRCRVTSPGKLSSATVDFVAPLRLWHGLRPPPMVGFVERESGGPASRSALRAFERAEFRSARELQGGRESEHANAPRLFNCPVWTPPTGG